MGLESEVLHSLADPTVPFFDDANHSFEIVIIESAETCLHLVKLELIYAETPQTDNSRGRRRFDRIPFHSEVSQSYLVSGEGFRKSRDDLTHLAHEIKSRLTEKAVVVYACLFHH